MAKREDQKALLKKNILGGAGGFTEEGGHHRKIALLSNTAVSNGVRPSCFLL